MLMKIAKTLLTEFKGEPKNNKIWNRKTISLKQIKEQPKKVNSYCLQTTNANYFLNFVKLKTCLKMRL